MISVRFQGKPFNITVIQIYAQTSNAEEAEVLSLRSINKIFQSQHPETDVIFIIEDWNAKVGSQEIPGVTGKVGLGVQNETGEKLMVSPREHTGHSKHPLPTTQEKTLHRPHQMVKTKIRLTTFFAAEDGEALYSQQKKKAWS